MMALKRKKYPVNIIVALKTDILFPNTSCQLLSALKEKPIIIKNANKTEGRATQFLSHLLN
jgi:hypothetical protein